MPFYNDEYPLTHLPTIPAACNTRWPFAKMSVGDSFRLPADADGNLLAKLRSAASSFSRYHKRRLRVLLQPDGSYLCIRAADPKPRPAQV